MYCCTFILAASSLQTSLPSSSLCLRAFFSFSLFSAHRHICPKQNCDLATFLSCVHVSNKNIPRHASCAPASLGRLHVFLASRSVLLTCPWPPKSLKTVSAVTLDSLRRWQLREGNSTTNTQTVESFLYFYFPGT